MKETVAYIIRIEASFPGVFKTSGKVIVSSETDPGKPRPSRRIHAVGMASPAVLFPTCAWFSQKSHGDLISLMESEALALAKLCDKHGLRSISRRQTHGQLVGCTVFLEAIPAAAEEEMSPSAC